MMGSLAIGVQNCARRGDSITIIFFIFFIFFMCLFCDDRQREAITKLVGLQRPHTRDDGCKIRIAKPLQIFVDSRFQNSSSTIIVVVVVNNNKQEQEQEQEQEVTISCDGGHPAQAAAHADDGHQWGTCCR